MSRRVRLEKVKSSGGVPELFCSLLASHGQEISSVNLVAFFDDPPVDGDVLILRLTDDHIK